MGATLPDFDDILRGALGDVLLRPWFDRAAVALLGTWYFPLSRAWAAGLACDGSPADFAVHAGLAEPPPGILVRRPIERLHALRGAHAAAEAARDHALFGAAPASPAACAALETARHAAAHALMSGRALFGPVQALRGVPPVAFDVASPEAVEAAHGARRRAPDAAFAPPAEAGAGWQRSVVIADPETGARTSWLRRPAPVALAGCPNDHLHARISEPPDACSGTLVFAHGIAMEEEFWHGTIEPLGVMAEEGLRVIRPEAPWHMHRRAPGTYGGEPVLARGPLGLLDFMHAAVVEIGLLTAWARARGDGPVAVGGVSLGALTAQLVAVAARHWPPAMRPDALLLVTPSASLTAVAFDGSLTRALGVDAALSKAGWTSESLEAWRPLLEPLGPPACAPEDVVLVLGEADDVTPYAHGRALAESWGVPAGNVFAERRGHFTSTLGLSRDAAPLRRLAQRLRTLG